MMVFKSIQIHDLKCQLSCHRLPAEVWVLERPVHPSVMPVCAFFANGLAQIWSNWRLPHERSLMKGDSLQLRHESVQMKHGACAD